MKLLHPIPTGRLTDGYGPRGHVPGVGDLGFHHGQDWAAPAGTPIRAMHDGWVRLNYYDPLGGWMVIINDGKGMESSYQHMRAKAKVPLGSFVRAGAHIGNVGSSGASTGPHLHAEIWLGGYAYRGGTSVDPMIYLTPKPKPKPEPIPARNWRDEDDEMKPTVHVRQDAKGGFSEGTRAHPDIGKDLKPGQSRRDGKVTIYRGWEASGDKDVVTAWARTHANGFGNGSVHSWTDRDSYIAIQAQATRLSVAIHG